MCQPGGIVTLNSRAVVFAFLLMTLAGGASQAAVGETEPETISLSIPDGTGEDIPFVAHRVAHALEMPWAIAFLPDGRILVTERAGRLRVIEGGELHADSIAGVPEVVSGDHAGLLDVIVAPDFETTRTLYLSYVHGATEAANVRVMRAKLDGMSLASREVIFDSRPAAPGLNQLGGRLAFGPDGLLYLTLGDRFDKNRAQDLLDHAGSIIRIREDGGVPSDNPFVGRSDALPEIYSYGHRNPQGLAVNRLDGKLWSVEHGPRGGDELNVIEAGANYGWPLATFGVDYNGDVIAKPDPPPGLAPPVRAWVPSIAPSSLAAYRGDLMPPSWRRSFLVGALAGERLVRLEMLDGHVVREEEFLAHRLGRIRDVAVSPDGFVYLLTDGYDAALYRLEPDGDEIAQRMSRKLAR